MSSEMPGTCSTAACGGHLRVVPPPRPRVLLIDDDELVLRTYALMLRRGCEVDTALGGRAGLECLASGQRYDAIVCDLQMPDVDGSMVRRELLSRDEQHAACFIYCTGALPESHEVQALACEDAVVLHKPCTPDELRGAIGRVVADNEARRRDRL